MNPEKRECQRGDLIYREDSLSGHSSSGPHHFLHVTLNLLTLGYSIRFQAPGRSMEPTIFHGETITAEPVEPSRVGRGDIILYRQGKGVIAHRVLRAHHSFITRGDALVVLDDPVKSSEVLGKVICVERAGRRIRLDNWQARCSFEFRQHVRRLKRALRRLLLPAFSPAP
jgi:signal peptidase